MVKISEFKRWLESQGVQVADGRSHWKLYYNGKQTVLPRHPSKELKEGTRRAILKQLGIREGGLERAYPWSHLRFTSLFDAARRVTQHFY